MKSKSENDHYQSDFEIAFIIFSRGKRVDKHCGLTHHKNQLGKPFGRGIVDYTQLATQKAYRHDDEKRCNDNVKSIKIHSDNYSGLFLEKLLLDFFHILKHILFFARITQKCGGMIYRGHKIVTLFKPHTVLLGDLEIGLDKSHCADSAKANDNLGIDMCDLLAKITDAGILLLGKGIAVFGRTAFQNIGYVNVLAGDIDRIEKFVKQLTCAANEGGTCQILLLTGRFADKHNIGIFISYTENTVCSRFVKRAFIALGTAFFKLVPFHICFPFGIS